jgi:Mg-chelatase subunit ChlD
MIVLLTDGRANVSLGKSNEEPDAIAEGAPKPSQDQLKTEVLDMAKRVGASGFNLLVIDTENKVRPSHGGVPSAMPPVCPLVPLALTLPDGMLRA